MEKKEFKEYTQKEFEEYSEDNFLDNPIHEQVWDFINGQEVILEDVTSLEGNKGELVIRVQVREL